MNRITCKGQNEHDVYYWVNDDDVFRSLRRLKRKVSSPLRRDEREAFGVLVEESHWLGPGSLQDIIRQQY